MSKRWHEANQLKHNYSYRSSSKPKSSYKPKSTYKPDYSKTYYQSKSNYKSKSNYNTNYRSNYSNPTHKSKNTYKNKSTNNSNSNDDNILMALLCVCGILAFFISFAVLENPIGFPPILIGLLLIIYIIWWIIERITKKVKSFKNKESSKPINEWKTCPDCGHKLIKVQKKCPYCKHEFE